MASEKGMSCNTPRGHNPHSILFHFVLFLMFLFFILIFFSLYHCAGRFYGMYFEACGCEDPSVTLVRHGYWPVTPKNPNVAVDFELMELITSSQIECQTPLKGFLDSLIHKGIPTAYEEVGLGSLTKLNINVNVHSDVKQFIQEYTEDIIIS